MFNLGEEDEDLLGLFKNAPTPSNFVPEPEPAAVAAPAPIDPAVKEYIAKKFDLGNYTQENRDKLVSGTELGTGDKMQAALAAVGAGFMGKDAASAGSGVLSRAKTDARNKLEDFDKGRQEHIQNYSLDKEAAKSDPGSDRNVAFRKSIESNFPRIAQSYGDAWNDVTLEDQEALFKPLQLREQTDARKQAAALLAGQRSDAREDRKLQRDLLNSEKEQKLHTPYGLANSEDDAKKLKEAFESKQNFDSKIQEMIDLRTKHGGGALLNREDVARGKQLSKDLLLEYKNMAKLGVLSAADEKIINAIIPADPLQYNSPLAAIQGQDPILGQLKKFKGDANRDFNTKVGTRTRSGVDSVAKGALGGGGSGGGGKVKMLDPKGRPKLVDEKDVKAAIAAGGKLVDGPMVGGQ